MSETSTTPPLRSKPGRKAKMDDLSLSRAIVAMTDANNGQIPTVNAIHVATGCSAGKIKQVLSTRKGVKALQEFIQQSEEEQRAMFISAAIERLMPMAEQLADRQIEHEKNCTKEWADHAKTPLNALNDKEDRIKELEEELLALQEAVSEEKQKNKQLRQDIETARTQEQDANIALAEARTETTSLQNQLRDAKELIEKQDEQFEMLTSSQREQLNTLRSEHAFQQQTQQQQISSLQSQVDSKTQELTWVQSNLSEAKIAAEKASLLSEENQRLHDKLEAFNEAFELQQRNLRECATWQGKAEAMSETISKLEEERNELFTRAELQASNMTELERTNAQLESSLKQCHIDLKKKIGGADEE